jgi:hypothetical protein
VSFLWSGAQEEKHGTRGSGHRRGRQRASAYEDHPSRRRGNGSPSIKTLTQPDRLVKLEVELLHGDIYAIRGDFDLVVSSPLRR